LPKPAKATEDEPCQAYYSTVFEQRANDVWNMIRDFNSHSILVRDEGQNEIDRTANPVAPSGACIFAIYA